MQYLVHAFNDNTIRFVLKYPGLLNKDMMLRAVRMLSDSVDVLHASFRPGHARACWEVHEAYEESSCFTFLQTSADPMTEAVSQALLPVAPDNPTQIHCSLVQSAEESVVVFRISHLCADGCDGRYLLIKLAQAYRLAAEGQETLEMKNGSRATEQIYAGLDRKTIRSLMKDPRTGVKSIFPYPSEKEGTPRVVRKTVAVDVMQAARGRARQWNATANDLLLAACYAAYGQVPGVDADAPMSITAMMDLRRHCKNGDTEGLSNATGSLPTMLPNGAGGSFEEILREIARQTALTKADPLGGLKGMPLLHGAMRILPLWLLQKGSARIYGSMTVGMTNLGELDVEKLAMGGMLPCEGWFGGPLKKKPGMQVSIASLGGNCALCVVGGFTDEDACIVQQMLDDMAGYLTAYACAENHCVSDCQEEKTDASTQMAGDL